MTGGAIIFFAFTLIGITVFTLRAVRQDSERIVDAALTRQALDAAASEQHHRELLAVIHEYSAEVGGVYSLLTTQDERLNEFLGHIGARLHQHECEMWDLNVRVGHEHGKRLRMP